MNQLYLYCLADAGAGINLPRSGFEERKVFSLVQRDISALVSESSAKTYPVTEENIFLHEEVIEKAMEQHTVLPMRFNSFLPDADSVEKFLHSYYELWKKNFAHVRGKWEFGVRAIWDVEEMIKEAGCAARYEDFMARLPVPRDCSPAGAYWVKAMEKHFFSGELERLAQKYSEEIGARFQEISADRKIRVLETKKMFCTASYLIARENAGRFQEAQERVKRMFPRFKFMFSGPWPPYNFVQMGEEWNGR